MPVFVIASVLEKNMSSLYPYYSCCLSLPVSVVRVVPVEVDKDDDQCRHTGEVLVDPVAFQQTLRHVPVVRRFLNTHNSGKMRKIHENLEITSWVQIT